MSRALPAVLAGARRVGAHVLLAESPREPFARVARRPPTFALRTREEAATLHARFAYADVAGAAVLPRFVDAVPAEALSVDAPAAAAPPTSRSLLVFETAPGVSLHEILLRSDLQAAQVDPAVLLHVVARAFRAAAAPPLAGTAAGAAVTVVDAQQIRVGFDGSVAFLGRLPRRVPEVFVGTAVDVVRPWIAARALVQRAVAGVAGAGALLSWMESVAFSVRALDAALWNEVADRVAALVDADAVVDAALLGGLARALFPEDAAAAAELAEELALLDDDDLAAVPA